MTRLLKKAFDEAAKLAPEEQDALARALLHDLESEQNWKEAFGPGELDGLSTLADEAISEHRRGTTQPLNPDEL
jgi:hypothetical protein